MGVTDSLTRVNLYRYGFNGMEKDDEISGSGNSYDFGARLYDSRIGRWRSVDPLASKYPTFSPYSAFANSPIIVTDIDGRENVIIVGYDSGKMWGDFMDKAISESKSLEKSQAGETTTIVLFVGTLTEDKYAAVLKKATDAGVKVEITKTKDELVNYINERPKSDRYEGGVDLISDLVYIGHSGEQSLFISNRMNETNPSLDNSDFEDGTIDKKAFTQESACVFASCNSANKKMSSMQNISSVASETVSKSATGAKFYVNWTNGNMTWSSGTRTYENGVEAGSTSAENKNSTSGGNIEYKGKEAPLKK